MSVESELRALRSDLRKLVEQGKALWSQNELRHRSTEGSLMAIADVLSWMRERADADNAPGRSAETPRRDPLDPTPPVGP